MRRKATFFNVIREIESESNNDSLPSLEDLENQSNNNESTVIENYRVYNFIEDVKTTGDSTGISYTGNFKLYGEKTDKLKLGDTLKKQCDSLEKYRILTTPKNATRYCVFKVERLF